LQILPTQIDQIRGLQFVDTLGVAVADGPILQPTPHYIEVLNRRAPQDGSEPPHDSEEEEADKFLPAGDSHSLTSLLSLAVQPAGNSNAKGCSRPEDGTEEQIEVRIQGSVKTQLIRKVMMYQHQGQAVKTRS
jgi:hypothetical protein